MLLNAIKMKVHENQPAAIDNNFEKALSATQAAYANEVFRSSYNLGFLGVTEPIAELAPRQPLYKEKPRILTKFLQKASDAQRRAKKKRGHYKETTCICALRQKAGCRTTG